MYDIFIAVVFFIIGQTGKYPNCHQQIVVYSSNVILVSNKKKNKLLVTQATRWINTENIMLSKRIQSRKEDVLCVCISIKVFNGQK